MYTPVIYGTHVAQAGIYDAVHLGDPPLDDVAEVFVVDVKVLSAHRALGPLFEFVLTMTAAKGFGPLCGSRKRKKAYACINPSFSRVAMSLLSSLTCRPTLPAKSSSLRLRVTKDDENDTKRWHEHSHLMAR